MDIWSEPPGPAPSWSMSTRRFCAGHRVAVRASRRRRVFVFMDSYCGIWERLRQAGQPGAVVSIKKREFKNAFELAPGAAAISRASAAIAKAAGFDGRGDRQIGL